MSMTKHQKAVLYAANKIMTGIQNGDVQPRTWVDGHRVRTNYSARKAMLQHIKEYEQAH